MPLYIEELHHFFQIASLMQATLNYLLYDVGYFKQLSTWLLASRSLECQHSLIISGNWQRCAYAVEEKRSLVLDAFCRITNYAIKEFQLSHQICKSAAPTGIEIIKRYVHCCLCRKDLIAGGRGLSGHSYSSLVILDLDIHVACFTCSLRNKFFVSVKVSDWHSIFNQDLKK